MSVNVKIKKKGILNKDLKLEDVLLDGMRYGIMDDSYRLEEGKVGDTFIVFDSKNIGRGYDVFLTKNEVQLQMPLPTSYQDIHFFYQYIKILCEKMHTKEFIREEETVTFEQIASFIEIDIQTSEGALHQMEEKIDNNEYKQMYIFGAINPIAIGKKELLSINGDVKKFGEFMHHLQEMDLYYATPSVYQRKDGTFFGVYVLTENVSSILPYEAQLLTTNSKIEVKEWNICFVIDGNVAGTIPYEKFLSSVKKEEEYDSEHFIITISKTQMKKLVDKYKIDL